LGYRVKLQVGKRILFSKSYPTKEKAERAKDRMRGAIRVIRS